MQTRSKPAFEALDESSIRELGFLFVVAVSNDTDEFPNPELHTLMRRFSLTHLKPEQGHIALVSRFLILIDSPGVK